jgi:pilus assembly protein Flp/PilA
MPLISRFLHDTKAATSMEYALVGALIAVVIIGAVTKVGSNLQAKFFGPIAGNLS